MSRPAASLAPLVHGFAAVCWGAVPVWFYASGRIQHYLQGQFQVYALAGGLGLIVLGLFSMLTAREGADCGCGHDHDHAGEAHAHESQNPWTTLLLMILPILVAVVLTRDDYSAAFIERRSRASSAQSLDRLFANLPPYTRETLERDTPRDEDGRFLVDLAQLYWSASDPEMRAVMDGIPVVLEGKITAESEALDPGGTRLRLYRLMITCCAADAAVIGVPLAFEDGRPEFAQGRWVTATGTVAYEDREGDPTALVRVTSLTESAPPEPVSPLPGW